MHPPMRMSQTPLLPTHRITSPIDSNPPLRKLKPQQLKQLGIHIDALHIASHARVHNLDSRDRFFVLRVVNANKGTAEGVAVRVGAVVHFQVRDGDDVFAGPGGDVAGGTASSSSRRIIREVAGVCGCEGDGDREGEGEGAGFHFCRGLGLG